MRARFSIYQFLTQWCNGTKQNQIWSHAIKLWHSITLNTTENFSSLLWISINADPRTEIFPHLPIQCHFWLKTHLPNSLPHPPHSLHPLTLTISIYTDPSSFFLPPTPRGLRGQPYEKHQGTSHRRRSGSAFSVRVGKYWNKLPTSGVMVPPVNIFKNRLEKFGKKSFPISQIDWILIFPIP